jgi:hypothetical protein
MFWGSVILHIRSALCTQSSTYSCLLLTTGAYFRAYLVKMVFLEGSKEKQVDLIVGLFSSNSLSLSAVYTKGSSIVVE